MADRPEVSDLKGMVSVLKVCAVCQSGFGVGDILGGRVREVLDDQGVRYDLEVVDSSEATGHETDLMFVTDELSGRLSNDSALVVAIQNFTNRSEVRGKVTAALDQLQPRAWPQTRT
jgi:galactitol-specific phosphotransferase system IIB component